MRGSHAASFRAIPGGANIEDVAIEDESATAYSCSWIVRPKDLWLDGRQAEPEGGDRIEVSAGDTTFRYAVVRGPEGRVYRPVYTGSTGLWRIFAVEISKFEKEIPDDE
jgi:hypothetical protein